MTKLVVSAPAQQEPELLPAEQQQIHATAARILRDMPAPELGSITISRNPWAPFAERDQRMVSEPLTLSEAFAREGINPDGQTPWIACINGDWVSRAEWSARLITRDDVALLVALPQGGRASRIITGIILIIVGVFLGGNPYLISAGASLVIGGIAYKKPPAYTPDTYASLANPSPTYNLQAQGNYARLGQAIPIRYGRTRFFPDFAAQPYGNFAGNEQYLYQLFCLGFGEFDIHQLYIEDQALDGALGADGYYSSSGIWRDISWQIVPPGGAVTLFPTRVLVSDAVSGQELLTNASVGPFQIIDAEVNQIAIDVVCPRGLYYANDSSELDSRSVAFDVFARPLIQSGASWVPNGPEVRIGQEQISAATNTAQRRSYLYSVATGRYQVRAVRTNAKDTSNRTGNDLNWVGLRGFVPGAQSYGSVTLLAMRMRATDQLSSSSSRKINIDATRMLREWSPASGWSAPVATRSIAAAFADACTNDEYGLGIDDSRLPLADLHDLEQVWDWPNAASGCAFDYGFDRRITASEALTHIAAAGDSVWYQQGGLVRVRRQQAAGVPVQLFNMRNIRRGSLNITWRMPASDQPDCIDIWYWDELTNRQEVVRAMLPGGTQLKPQRVDITGVQRRAQAWRIGMRMLLSARWHRIQGSLETEMEGMFSSPGDAIAIAHDMIDRATSAELVSHTGTGKASGDVLTLSEPVDFADAGSSYYVEFSTVRGGYSGPWRVTAGAQSNLVVLAEPVADAAYVPQVGGNMEHTRVNFGAGQNLALKAVLVTPLTVRGNRISLNWYLDDARAWDLAGISTPSRSQPFNLALITRPKLLGLNVVWSGTLAAPTLDLSWEPSPGALRYFLEISDDNDSWTRLPDATGTSARISVPLRQIYLRVAAVGSLKGDWEYWSGNPANMQSIPAVVTGLRLANAVAGQPTVFADTVAQFDWGATARADGYEIEVWAGGVRVATHGRAEPRFSYTAEINRADGGLRRAFELRVYGVNGAGRSDSPASLAVSNPQEAATTVQAQQEGRSLLITVPASLAADHDLTEFWLSQAISIDPQTEPTIAVSAATGVTVPAPAIGTWRVWAANRDKFGRDGLNLSPAYVINIISAASGVKKVADATAITAATGSAPPGGDDFLAVYSVADGKMYLWRPDLSPARYTASVSAADIDGRLADAQINVPLLDRIAATETLANDDNTRVSRLEASSAGFGNLLPPMSKWVAEGGASIVSVAPDSVRLDDAFAIIPPTGVLRTAYSSLQLKPNTVYTLAFSARVPGGTTPGIVVDIFPDNLPQTVVQMSSGGAIARYVWTFTTGVQSELSACAARVFHPAQETHVFDVSLVEGALPKAWTLSDAATRARITSVEQAVANEEGARALAVQQVQARLDAGGDVRQAIVQVQSEATATANKLTATHGITLDAGGALSGLKSYNDGTSSALRITANNVFVGTGNLVVDDGFYSPQWWSSGGVPGGNAAWPASWVPQDGDGQQQPRRFLRINPSGLIGWLGKTVAAEPGGEYRVRLRIYRSSGFVGKVFAGLHFPGVAWAMPGPWIGDAWNGGLPYLSNAQGIASWETYTGIWRADVNQSYVQTRIDAEISAGYCEVYLECMRATGASLTVDGAIKARHLSTEAVDTVSLQARNAVIDYAFVNTLSALSAQLGSINSAQVTLSGSGDNYIRSDNKWWADGFNGFISLANLSTGSYFQEFYATDGAAIVEQRMGNGSAVGGPRFRMRIRTSDGVDRLLIDPLSGSFKFKGTVEADGGYFSGECRATYGTFTDLSAGILRRSDSQTFLDLSAYGHTPLLSVNGETRVWADGAVNWLRNIAAGGWSGANTLWQASYQSGTDSEGQPIIVPEANGTTIVIDTGINAPLQETDMRAHSARVRIDTGYTYFLGDSVPPGLFSYIVDIQSTRIVSKHMQFAAGGTAYGEPYPQGTQRLFLVIDLTCGQRAAGYNFTKIDINSLSWWIDKIN